MGNVHVSRSQVSWWQRAEHISLTMARVSYGSKMPNSSTGKCRWLWCRYFFIVCVRGFSLTSAVLLFLVGLHNFVSGVSVLLPEKNDTGHRRRQGKVLWDFGATDFWHFWKILQKTWKGHWCMLSWCCWDRQRGYHKKCSTRNHFYHSILRINPIIMFCRSEKYFQYSRHMNLLESQRLKASRVLADNSRMSAWIWNESIMTCWLPRHLNLMLILWSLCQKSASLRYVHNFSLWNGTIKFVLHAIKA